MATTAVPPPADTSGAPRLRRRIGLLQATAMNMAQMCGVGPFITIPAMVIAFGGPQAILGWVFGALLALADGLVWAELGAAMPGSGGTYVYLREAFQYRTGRLMPFLFVWTAMLFIPLIMSTGIVGFVSYLGYLWPGMTKPEAYVVGIAAILLIVAILWRRIDSIGVLATVLCGIMVATVLTVIVAAYTHFHAHQVFTFPHGAFDITRGGFWVGFAGGLTVGVYDYLGYNTSAYLGAEIRRPGRTIPRSIVLAVISIMVIYLAMQIGVLGVVDWHTMLDTSSPEYSSVASVLLETTWGEGAAKVVTVFILLTAFTSVLAGLLAGSRVPYDAARDGVFFRSFARLHKKHEFPTMGLLAMGAVTILGFVLGELTSITRVIQLLTAVMVLVQALAQILALTVLRQRQPTLSRPYRMWLYPLPSILAAVGWVTVYLYADKNAPGLHPIELSLLWVVGGVIAFGLWARSRGEWPFGPKPIEEKYLQAQASGISADDEVLEVSLDLPASRAGAAR
ncbi:amino acid/polyamine/organocation transporter (APC superfamily) [Motilibacter rhizosphaerae]|uniref:Amino acid/polyamine/organocation transporter (APC superfamily) n=1 Tax=Motilibacter rhizosphaerae TaxID=598652 RepID=A0A4Q7NUD9_9ACTN|nr:APC family permease [Motilibacter rhizosphaerae]RZS90801.1 amino acid/polyamine/organocation transporter (APC superfamily) [Motilibacter rhizosphaerae]